MPDVMKTKIGAVLGAGALLFAGACSDNGITGPSAGGLSSAAVPVSPGSLDDQATAVLRWNEIARQLVAEHRTDPPMASRFYALLSVAQYEAVRAALAADRTGRQGRIMVDRAIVRAAVAILTYAYPDRRDWIAAQATRWLNGQNETGVRIGDMVANRVLAHARSDRSDLAWRGEVPIGEGLWFSSLTPAQMPLRPRWGETRPWFMRSGNQFRPEPPPAFGSKEFLSAVAEVREISDHRTDEQLRIALFWADGVGTSTPPGHWNAIAADLIRRYRLDEERAAFVFALLNASVMDAGIACWDAKYHYWLIRPPQTDPAITTPVGLPNFPSYVSGHASFSGAASEVLGALFPGERTRLAAMATEAALSRLYGGIHYRFDNEIGLRLGRTIGALAIRQAAEDRFSFLP